MHGTSGTPPVTLSGYGGLVTLADPTSVPEGASPRTYNTDFSVGGCKTRAGLTSVYAITGESIGPNLPLASSSSTWTNPTNILVADGNYTTQHPVNIANALNITDFVFNVPATSSVTGAVLSVTGYSSAPCNLQAQLMVNGSPIGLAKIAALSTSPTTITFGGLTDQWGNFLSNVNVNSLTFGVQLQAVESNGSPPVVGGGGGGIGVGNGGSNFGSQLQGSGFGLATVYLDSANLTLGINPGNSNFQYIDTFVAQDGTVKNLALDANGNFYVEDVTNSPGFLSLISEGITPGSYAIGVNGPDVQYLALSNLKTGSDMPIQYTPKWIDRITQVGPGAAPVFTPTQATANTYAISTITQYPQQSDPADPGYFQTIQQSAGPSSTAPGNVITVFYAQSGSYPQDMNLANAFNSGQSVYVYVSNTLIPIANGTFLVTSIGNIVPPGGSAKRWYFTYQVNSSNYVKYGGPDSSTGYYQQTVATMTTSVPVPGLTVGNQVTISGASVASYDSTWAISQALNSSQMVITGTQVTASIATYNYSLSGGSISPPVAGQLVTITGTTNADGALNLTNATILTATGGTSGSFTVAVSVVTAAFSPEDGQATTAGTQFQFDPGILTLGGAGNPIYGDSTGGTLTFTSATAQLISTGTKQGSVFFITRNGYYTAPAPPVTFAVPLNTTSLIATQIPTGPPNVVARGIILTESGQNGVPGGNFFTLPVPVQYVVNNVTYTATALIINDNTSTTATLTFTDSVLLNGLAVDVYGYNLFNQIEIGDPGWIAQYAGRQAYGQCRNKIQNFLNMSFDGGYISGQTYPLGWSTPDVYGSLVISPKFGNSYYIRNTTVSTLPVGGLITQSAYQDAYKDPIIQPNTLYSVRVTARCPAGVKTGNLVVALVANGIVYGSYTLPFASMTTVDAIYTGTLLTTEFLTTPANLQLQVSGTGMGPNADVEIDRLDVYPTAIPVLGTTVYLSYAGLPEQVDSVTGQVQFTSENQQPVNGAMVMYDTLYAMKGWGGPTPGSSLYSLQASGNLEPAQWQEPEVAQRSGGATGPLAFDLGEQWFVSASRPGLYLFEGGQPGKIMQEIYQVWDAINWAYGQTIWVKVDITHRRLYVGVPMATPNFWLPNAPTVSNPTSPNVILMCNYEGLDSGQELKSMPQMHTTMFGTLNAIDMRRKWSIWEIPSPYANFVQGGYPQKSYHAEYAPVIPPIGTPIPSPVVYPNQDEMFYICNGSSNSKIYLLDDTANTDDGLIIDTLYTTAGLVELSKRKDNPALGKGNTRMGFLWATIDSLGTVNVRLLPNRVLYPEPSGYNTWTVPGGFTPGSPSLYDCKCPINFFATRTFVEFRENDGHVFSFSNCWFDMKKDVWNSITSGKGGQNP